MVVESIPPLSQIPSGKCLSGVPLQPVSRRKLFDSFHESPGARHVVQREITIKAGKTQPAFDFRMDKNRFQLGAKKKIFALTCDVERFDSHAIARQNKAS